jgi:hypothetical protein
MENTLAYYVTELIWAVKSFIDEAPIPSKEKKNILLRKNGAMSFGQLDILSQAFQNF